MTVARPSGVPGESTSGVVPRLGAPLGRVHTCECGLALVPYKGNFWACLGCKELEHEEGKRPPVRLVLVQP